MVSETAVMTRPVNKDMRHATQEQILAYRDGELTDTEMERHLRVCPLCRRELENAKWLRAHLPSGSGKASGPVPNRDEIAAYLDEALDDSEMQRVEIHIRNNESCLVILNQLLAASLDLKDPVPSASHVEALKERLKKRPRVLGRLMIFIGDQLEQLFLPAEFELDTKLRSERVPEMGFISARLAMEDSTTTLGSVNQEALSFESSLSSAEQSAAPPRSTAPPEPTPPEVLDAGRWRIRVVTRARASEMVLELTITDSESGEPTQRLPVRLKPERNEPISAETDKVGRIRLSLPDGSARLEIGRGPDLILDIVSSTALG